MKLNVLQFSEQMLRVSSFLNFEIKNEIEWNQIKMDDNIPSCETSHIKQPKIKRKRCFEWCFEWCLNDTELFFSFSTFWSSAKHNAILAVHPVLLLFVFICALNLIWVWCMGLGESSCNGGSILNRSLGNQNRIPPLPQPWPQWV